MSTTNFGRAERKKDYYMPRIVRVLLVARMEDTGQWCSVRVKEHARRIQVGFRE